MKQHNLFFVIYIALIVLLQVSCRIDATLEFEHEPKLTFNCILNPDSIIRANLTLSQALGTGSEFLTVDNAEILLTENQIPAGKLKSQGNGNYTFRYFPKSGNVYSVQIKIEGYPTLHATTKIPNKTKIEFVPLPQKPEETSKIEIKIYDMPGANYYWSYAYSVNKKTGNKYLSDWIDNHSPYFDDFNRVIEAETQYGFYYSTMLRITDRFYDGEILRWYENTRFPDIYHDYSVYLETDSCYDRYLKTTIQLRMLENQEIPLSEPVQIFSNVENGYGVFGSCVKVIRKN